MCVHNIAMVLKEIIGAYKPSPYVRVILQL